MTTERQDEDPEIKALKDKIDKLERGRVVAPLQVNEEQQEFEPSTSGRQTMRANRPPAGDRTGNSGSGRFNSPIWLILVLVIAVIAAFYFSSQNVPTKVYNEYVTGASAAITKAQADIKAQNDQIDTAIKGLPNQISNGVSTETAALQGQVQNNASLLSDLRNQIATANSDIVNLRSDIGRVGNDVARLDTTDLTNKVNTLQSAVDSLTTKVNTAAAAIDSQNTKITKLQTDLTALQTQVAQLVSGSSGGSSGGTPSNLYATVLGNSFTGSKILTFSPDLAVSTSQTQSFNFTITNNTGKTANNIQLAIGLGLFTPASQPSSLPAGTTVTLALNGYLTSFTPQSTGQSSVLGFTNVITTGIFGGIGSISQNVGTATYIMTITVAAGATNPVPAFNVFPQVQIVGSN